MRVSVVVYLHTLIYTFTGISIGIGVGSAAGFMILVFVVIFVAQRFKHKRQIMLKNKFFKQNRGQLLQQLVSPRADIAERMIIPIDELAKATKTLTKLVNLEVVAMVLYTKEFYRPTCYSYQEVQDNHPERNR
jgi:hypothetical protein